jgi:hypothetical protein
VPARTFVAAHGLSLRRSGPVEQRSLRGHESEEGSRSEYARHVATHDVLIWSDYI